MTQNERVLFWLKNHKGLEPLSAWTELGIYRLGARIFDLKKQGHNISSTKIKVMNKFGEECEVAYYQLKEDQQ
jgi:hypothetical protein